MADFLQTLREIGRSTQYTPYDVLGGPVDLATMLLRPLGYNVQNPVGGSDWLIQLARKYGVADQPTGSTTENLTRLATGIASPVVAAKAGQAVFKAGELTSEQANRAADALVRAITQNPQATATGVIQETAMPVMQAVAPRADNFRKWFGQSKLVDESGEPLVVYHGSGSKNIEEFDLSKFESVQKGDWGEGIYFTPSKWMAEGYRKSAVTKGDKTIQQAFDKIEEKAKEFGTTGMNKWLDLQSGKITEKQYNELGQLEDAWRSKIKKAESSERGGLYPAYLKLENPYVYTYGGITEPDLAKIAKQQGHDGIIVRNEEGAIEEIVVFDPKQIKSATKNIGTFDPTTANIYRGMAITPSAGLLGDEGE